MEKELTALRREILLLSLLQHPQQNTINPSKGLRNACLYGINIAASQKKHNLKTWLSQERIVSWCPVCPQSHEGNLSNFSKLKVMKIKTFCWVQPQYLFCKVLCVILDYWLDSFFLWLWYKCYIHMNFSHQRFSILADISKEVPLDFAYSSVYFNLAFDENQVVKRVWTM